MNLSLDPAAPDPVPNNGIVDVADDDDDDDDILVLDFWILCYCIAINHLKLHVALNSW